MFPGRQSVTAEQENRRELLDNFLIPSPEELLVLIKSERYGLRWII